MPQPPGRPTKLSAELTETICDALRRGVYLETAAALAGVAKSTVYDWLRQGARSDNGPLREFSDAVEKAMAEAELADLEIIGAAARAGSWQAAAWRLERKHPDRWGRKDRVKVEATTKTAEVCEFGFTYEPTAPTTPDDSDDFEAAYPRAWRSIPSLEGLDADAPRHAAPSMGGGTPPEWSASVVAAVAVRRTEAARRCGG